MNPPNGQTHESILRPSKQQTIKAIAPRLGVKASRSPIIVPIGVRMLEVSAKVIKNHNPKNAQSRVLNIQTSSANRAKLKKQKIPHGEYSSIKNSCGITE